MPAPTLPCLLYTGLTLSFTLTIAFTASYFFAPMVIDRMIASQTTITEGSQIYDDWVAPGLPIYLKFYLFDVLNPSAIEQGAKPSVREIGPLVYREIQTKTDIEFFEEDLVRYYQNKYYIYDEEKSKIPEDHAYTTINVPLFTAVNTAVIQHQWTTLALLLDVSKAVLGESAKPFRKVTAKEMIWGYKDALLEVLHLKDRLYPTTFGVYEGQNNTNNGAFIVHRGCGNSKLRGEITSWNRTNVLHWWSSLAANAINGTDGQIFHSSVDKRDKLYLYSPDVCRSMYATYKREAKVHGLTTYRFGTPAVLFLNQDLNPDNAGFCTPDQHHCLGTGLLNLTECQAAKYLPAFISPPIILSGPHFLFANQTIIDSISDMHPDEELHGTFLDIEPHVGLPLNLSKRIQINVYMESRSLYPPIEKLPSPLTFPVFWVDEGGEARTVDADKISAHVLEPLNTLALTLYSLIGIFALASFLFAIVLLFRRYWLHLCTGFYADPGEEDSEKLLSRKRTLDNNNGRISHQTPPPVEPSYEESRDTTNGSVQHDETA